MHVDEEVIQRLIHGELGAAEASRVEVHLEGCAECRHLVDDARQEEGEVMTMLGQLAAPDVALSAQTVIDNASTQPSFHGWARRAAAIVIALGVAGGVYAMPGSPVPGWVDRITGPGDTAMQAGGASASEVVAGGGIAVDAGARLAIMFDGFGSGTLAIVTLDDAREVTVTTIDGVASFDSDLDELTISGDGSTSSFEITVPRRAPHVEIRVDGRVPFTKSGDVVTAPREEPDSSGRYSLMLVP